MRQAIETAPRDGSAIILEDDASGTCDVAHWSPEAGEWVGQDGEPIKIKPSQWYPMPGDKYLLQEDEGSSNLSQVGPSAPRAHWQFAAFSIIATLIAATLLGLYFEQESQFPSQDSRKTDLLALQQQAEPNQAGAQVKRAVKSSAPKARQSLEKEQRSEVLANELADARRTIDGLNLQLRTEAAKTAQLLGQEREKATALMREAAAARQELTASTAQHGQALEEERNRSAALASEVAKARGEVETQAALLRKAGEESVQFKQAAESAIPVQTLEEERARSAALASELAKARGEVETQAALLRKAGEESAQLKQAAKSPIQVQMLEEERARSAALASELAKARGEVETQAALLRKAGEESAQLKQAAKSPIQVQMLEEERARSAALASELAKARGEVETQAALLRKAGEESVQLKQVAESAGQTLEEERARSAALMSELAKAHGDVETQAALLRKAGEDSVQLKQVAERAIMEMRQSLQQERQRTEAMTRDLESARRSLDERVTTGHATNSDIAQQTKATQAPAAEQRAATEALDDPEATRLIARASALLGQGNIGAARIVLERAAQNGSAQASFMLAETYDPVILSAWGTYGTRGEATKAREFYAKANAGGIQEAKDRLDALR